MSNRCAPVRPLTTDSASLAYPGELLVDKTTGALSYKLASNGNVVPIPVTHPTIGLTADGTEADGQLSWGGNLMLPTVISRDSNGHVTQVKTKKFILPSETSLSEGTATGSGNVVTGITLSGHKITLKKEISAAALQIDQTRILTDAWEGESAPYTQVVSVPGILATDVPTIDVRATGNFYDDIAVLIDWASVYRAVTGNGTITFYSKKQIVNHIPLTIQVVRA